MPEAKTLESKWEMDDSFKEGKNEDIWASKIKFSDLAWPLNFQGMNLQSKPS